MVKKYKILLWVLFPLILLATVGTISSALQQNPTDAEKQHEKPSGTLSRSNEPGTPVLLTSADR